MPLTVSEFLDDGNALDAYFTAMYAWLGEEGVTAAEKVIETAKKTGSFGPPVREPEALNYGPETIEAARGFISAAQQTSLFQDADASCVAACTTLFVTCLAQCGDEFLCLAMCAANYALCIRGCT